MKTKYFFLAVLCFFVLSVVGYTQPLPRTSEEVQTANRDIKIRQMRQHWEDQTSGLRTMAMIMTFSEVSAALEISDEQHGQLKSAAGQGLREWRDSPEVLKIQKEVIALANKMKDGSMPVSGLPPQKQNYDDETWAKMQDLENRRSSLQLIITSDIIDGILTPEQHQKMNEMLLANMENLPGISPKMFEGLNLTDAQKQRMKTLQKELEPDFEKYLESVANANIKLETRVSDALKKQEGATWEERVLANDKKMANDPEYKKILDEIQSLHKAFTTQFKTAMFDILTDEQWKRLQELVDNPPEHAKILGKKLRGESVESGGNASRGNEGSGWQPGPDSWKPGDAIPEEYRQQRNERSTFPRPTE